MRKIILPVTVVLIAALAATLLLAAIAAAGPSPQLALTGVEPDTLTSEAGGTLSIYGSGFTTATVARLVGFGLLDTTYVNSTALMAMVPAGIPAGAYDLQVTGVITSVALPSALTIVAATPVPGPTDGVVLLAIHLFLVLLLLLSLIHTARARWRKRQGAAHLTVTRGEKSMNALYVMYGVATVVYSLAVDVADFAQGHKTTIIVFDYVVLTYLFFFNSWFRNSVVFRALPRIQED